MSTTNDPQDPRLSHGVDDAPVPMAEVYLVLSDQDRLRGFVRPLRLSYVHSKDLGGCGTVTQMGQSIAETYARDPFFYGATYCAGCFRHRPVGVAGEFRWAGSDEKVGT